MESKVTTELLVEMLGWKRPDNSEANLEFCEKYLEPVFGEPDEWGNYLHTVENYNGTLPNVLFTAHHDTVHWEGGMQDVEATQGGLACLPEGSTSTCLGADCTTGVWLILGMIEQNIPGTYVIHAAEEVGCIGSSAFVEENSDWLSDYKYCISFDRFGYRSIITHQCGVRTASDEFAHSLARALKTDMLKPDSGGIYTDSNEYRGIVAECTNLSVGYFDQHTSKETQDLLFAEMMLSMLINADWSMLECVREPKVEAKYPPSSGSSNGRYGWMFDDYDNDSEAPLHGFNYGEDREDTQQVRDLMDLMDEYPYAIASTLFEYGITPDILIDELAQNERYAMQLAGVA